MHPHRVHTSAVATAFAVGLLAASGAAHAQNERRVGIVVTVKVNVTEDKSRQVAEQLGTAISGALPVDVIAGAETDRRLPPEGLPEECVADTACRNDLGRRLDADELLLLVIVELGEGIQIDTTWADVASGRSVSRPRIELQTGADHAAVLAKAPAILLPHIKKPEAKNDGPDIIIVPGDGADDNGRRMTVPAWIAAGVTGASAITGTVFAVSARQKFRSLDEDGCRNRICNESDVDTGERHAIIADVFIGVTLAAGVTTAVLYLTSGPGDSEPDKSGGPAVGIVATDDTVGLAIGGRF